MRTAAAQPHPWAQRRGFLFPESAASFLLARRWLRSGQQGGYIFGCLPSSPGWWRAWEALTGPGSARNGTGDAARRGPGCAALQLNRRRRPGAPHPRPSSRQPSALPGVPALPGLGGSRLGARSSRCARPSAPATLSSTGLCQRGDPLGLPLGWWAGSPSRHQPAHHARGPLFGGEPSLCFCDRKDAKCLPSDGGGSVVGVVGIRTQTMSVIFPIKSQTR